jgi:phospholipid N-methyltransferase
VICLTAGDLSPLKTLESKLQAGVSVSLLAELERALFRLRAEMDAAEWEFFCVEFPGRSIFEVVRLGKLSSKRLKKGEFSFPGDVLDVVMADAFQARESIQHSPAHLVSAWEYSLPAVRSIRARKAYFSAEIADLIRTTVKPRILILGAGQAREADDAIRSSRIHHAEFVALEGSGELAEHLRRNYLAHPLKVMNLGWRDVAHSDLKLGWFDLIYSASWLDSTEDREAVSWLEGAASMLRPGGRIIASNFAPGSRDAGWIEACWNWHPHYRSEEQLARLALELKHPALGGHVVFQDESGAAAYLELHSL